MQIFFLKKKTIWSGSDLYWLQMYQMPLSYSAQFCNEFAVPRDMLEHFKDITAQDIICSQVLHHPFLLKLSYTNAGSLTKQWYHQVSGGVTLKEEDIAVSNIRIDLTRGTNNPLQRYTAQLAVITYLFPVLQFTMRAFY